MSETTAHANTNTSDGATPVIEAIGIDVGYGSVSVIKGMHLSVKPGEVVALLGVNGAGKSTTVKALAGELRPTAGEIRLKGEVTTDPLHKRARRGLRLITEERSVFMGLSAADNLRLGGHNKDAVLEIFPELERLLRRKAGLLSGGEQQMLTLGRALASKPDILLIDELSLGLAPLVLERLLTKVREAADSGTGVLLVEQHIRYALEMSDRAYVLSRGQIVLQGDAADMLLRVDEIERSYLESGELADTTH